MRRAPARTGLGAAIAAVVLLALAPAVPAGPLARAADRGLVVVAQTRYEALPEERRVHVTIDAVATSYTPNPPDGLAYYPTSSFTLQPGSTNVAATAQGQPLEVTVDATDPGFSGITVTFVDGVFFEQVYPFQVAYDLPDPGGAPDRNLRISPSIVSFPVWAFGTSDEPGGSVTVELPAGFAPSVQGDALTPGIGADGQIVLSTTDLPDPFNFFSYVSADRPGAFADTRLTVQLGDRAAALIVRAWKDDPEWGAVMSELMTAGLPALHGLIGLPYSSTTALTVEEAATSRLGDYAGVYNNLTGVIQVRYDADAYVGLHEAAHLWFNGDLFPDRWIGEAYAEFYGVRAATAIGASGQAFDLTDDLLPDKIPLNDWGAIGAVDLGVEEYAYAASYHLAVLIFGRTDIGSLRAVWRGAQDDEMAYQPAHAGETPAIGVHPALAGWQELLDLLEERTSATFGDLWSEWVVNAQQEQLLEERATAREDYAAVIDLAGEWNLPSDLRHAMGAWNFVLAEADLTAARKVLAARGEIESRASAVGLTPPGALQSAFEATDGMADAQQEATRQVGALAAIADAADRLAAEQSIFEWIGLIGANPGTDLSAARVAYEADRLTTALRDATRALETRVDAEPAGRLRAGVAGGGLLVLGGGVVVGVRARRRRRAAAVLAEQTATVPIDPPAPASPA